MRIGPLLATFLFAVTLSAAHSPIESAKQLIVVIAPDWTSVDATMTAYDLRNGKWEPTGLHAPVIIGRSGLAWGRGVNRETGEGPVKREGDGKSPAGVFRIGTSFGFAATSPSRLAYKQLLDTTECVDDVKSSHYNTIVDRSRVPVDWSSSEKMRSIAVYEHGAVILHNDPPKPGGGSCIFLHLVSPNGEATSGCTSMPAAAMEALLQWIDPAERPLLVQLPQRQYDRLRPLWHLP